MPSLDPWWGGGSLLRTLSKGLGLAALPSPRIQKGARARMTVAALQGRQKGRPKVRLASSHHPSQPFHLPASSTRKSFLPSPFLPSRPSLDLSQTQPHLCVQASAFGFFIMRTSRDKAWGGAPLHPNLGWAPRGFSLSPGIRTGKCVAFNNTVQTCEIFGWCPVEVDDNIPR